jgi:hypothetical protein
VSVGLGLSVCVALGTMVTLVQDLVRLRM